MSDRLLTISRDVVRGLTIAVLGGILTVAVGLLIARIYGEQLLSVQTGSMMPALRPGDAVLVRSARLNDWQPGDIISYRSPDTPGLIITHRLIAIDPRSGWLTAHGDALSSNDPTFPPRLVVGRVWAVAPKLGLVMNSLRRPLGLTLAVYLPAAIVIGREGKHLRRYYTSRRYQLLRF